MWNKLEALLSVNKMINGRCLTATGFGKSSYISKLRHAGKNLTLQRNVITCNQMAIIALTTRLTSNFKKGIFSTAISTLFNLADVQAFRAHNEVIELSMGLEKLNWLGKLKFRPLHFLLKFADHFAVDNSAFTVSLIISWGEHCWQWCDLYPQWTNHNLYVNLQNKVTHLTTQTNCTVNMFGTWYVMNRVVCTMSHEPDPCFLHGSQPQQN